METYWNSKNYIICFDLREKIESACNPIIKGQTDIENAPNLFMSA